MNPNYFLQLPIYERVAFLENIPDHDTFTTLITMPEFGFLTNNAQLQERIYKYRVENYFSKMALYYESDISWKELYNRLTKLEKYYVTKNLPRILSLAKIMAREGKLMELKIIYYLYGVSSGPDGATYAAENGHFNVLKWMKNELKYIFKQDVSNFAAAGGFLDILKWMKEENMTLPNWEGANWAAANGELEVLKWMKENRLPLPNADTTDATLRRGHTAVLNWMRENNILF